MIEIQQALDLIESQCVTMQADCLGLTQLPGHVLADSIESDVDSPPFDKSMMDGFALQAADVLAGNPRLQVLAQVQAGAQFSGQVNSGQAVQIMTGAPVPQGADTVVMVEQTSHTEDQVEIQATVKAGQNILCRGTAMRAGQTIMSAGDYVRAEDVGLLAEAGAASAKIIPRPGLAVIATGDELVPVESSPTGSQIRNSNGPMIACLAKPYCKSVRDLGVGPDRAETLAEVVTAGLESDILVLSGGVSAGVADLVPAVLQQVGVKQIFHKVKIKPGKPVWFGVYESGEKKRTLVFGLPGNPVSSMVCFRVFVLPALLRMAGRDGNSAYASGKLSTEFKQRPGRTTYWPSRVTQSETGCLLEPLDWKGSADLRTLAQANCYAVFTGERAQFEPGETLPFLHIH
ncbi:MAG: molybdopterin molybdotransferase MoeA [Pirellulaceae bacterium]|nr:molybdopterin molybdotransferase MoeA [Pirellulaceae bacterium]